MNNTNEGRWQEGSAEASRAALIMFGARYAGGIVAALVFFSWIAAGALA